MNSNHKKNHLICFYLRNLIYLLIYCFLVSCLGKTAQINNKKKYSFLPKNKKIYIPYIINYTQIFKLDQKIRDHLINYFNINSDITITKDEDIESFNLYMTIQIHSYTIEPSYKTFFDTNPVNTKFKVVLDILIQSQPNDHIKNKIYLNNKLTTITYYYFIEHNNPLNNIEISEKKFLDYIGKNLEHLLNYGNTITKKY